MTLQEFKAWFEGFTEGMSGVPNKKQWARIQERVGEIERVGKIDSQSVYYHYYRWPQYQTTFTPAYSYSNILQTGLAQQSNTISSAYTLGLQDAEEIQ